MDTAAARLEQISALTRRERRLAAAFRSPSVDAEAEPADAVVAAARALGTEGISGALIGGVAVDIHSGIPCASLGANFAVHMCSGRDRAISALERAGFTKTGEFPHSVNFRHASGEPVQLAFDPAFDEMILRAETFETGGVRVRIVREDDLIAMKERAAADPSRRKSKRLRDQADVELLRGDVPDEDEGW